MPLPPPAPLKRTLYIGNFVDTPRIGQLQVRERTVVAVDEMGVIRAIKSERNLEDVVRELGWDSWEVEREEEGGEGWWAPGFVVSKPDTHTHAPQLPNLALFGSSTLLSWLETYTFPLESSLASLSNARRIYNRAVTSLLRHGTTTAAYYATTHVPATNLLATLAHSYGQRAFIGRVCMDHPEINKPFYRDSDPTSALRDTKACIEHCQNLDPEQHLVAPILTPRFAPSCTKELLGSLGELAKEHSPPLRIQTHISENTSEVELVKKMFPECDSYMDVYDRYSLLTPQTVLAHAVHLDDTEIQTLTQRKAGVAHCPVSNTALASGMCPVRKLLDSGVKVGLGTDVSGGCSCSVLVAGREACGVSRLLASTLKCEEVERERVKLSVEEALYLGTVGGAEVLGLGDKVGKFEVGMEWDAQRIEVTRVPEVEENDKDETTEREDADLGLVELWGKETWDEKVAKWMYCGDDRNTRKVWVKGRCVWE
ncbi:MAG: hypothetical protein Q9190_006542, partial [Brigantiaea leucoxantha]